MINLWHDANLAYEPALAGDMCTARSVVAEQIAAHETGHIGVVCERWIGRAMNRLAIQPRPQVHPASVIMKSDRTGEQAALHEIRPSLRWAGTMFSAKVFADPQAWTIGLTLLPACHEQRVEHLLALLGTCVATVHDRERRMAAAGQIIMSGSTGYTAARADPLRAYAYLN